MKGRRIFRIIFMTFVMYIITHLIVFLLLPFCLVIIPFLDKIQIAKMKKGVSQLLLTIVGVRPRIRGAENIDPSKKYVLVSNYPSFYAFLVLMTVLPESQMIAHAFMKKIPIFGLVVGKIGAIYVDPKRIIETKTSMDNALKNPENIIIFPEGGRSTRGEIKRFQRGFIYLLRNSPLELLPVTLNGLYSLKPAKRWYLDPDAETEIIIHNPLNKEEMARQTDKELVDKVEAIVRADYVM